MNRRAVFITRFRGALSRGILRRVLAGLAICLCLPASNGVAGARARQTGAPRVVPKFELRKSGLELERRTQAGAFVDVLGSKSAVYGYEGRALEAWVYPLQILDRLELSFKLAGYPLEFRGADTAALVNVRPEATVVTYSHAAFTVRQIIFAPVGEPGVVMLLDVDSALPLTVSVSFRPRLRLMWPAGTMTPSLNWDENGRFYSITEEGGLYAGLVGSPAARDASQMPYQEEPRDVPARFEIELPPETLKTSFVPVVVAGGVRGHGEARETYARLLRNARELYEKNVAHYRRLNAETTDISTPDKALDEAFRWAKVGIDKALVENPLVGTGLVAGFRTAGESERPGFAWFFGRDALWTALAVNSYGDFPTTRAALEFLRKYQREDGKIPHEISQSAALIPWFTDYPYPWASADATPLYIVAHADYLRASGDTKFTRASWESLLKAYRFTAATDTDANALVENTNAGHGWVEGGALYPPHEEIYMQGLWVEALRSLAEMAERLGADDKLRQEFLARAEATRKATEQTYWLGGRGFYAFATNQPRSEPRKADPGPNRAVRQSRMDELDKSKLIDEDTVLPAVPLWWRVLEDARAQSEIDRLGSGHMATDWGARIISDESRLYDPLSYHHGSVWPLFTGWASLGAYRYGRPHVGLQALMANVLLKRAGALGYVTELLSGDFQAPFGRSSHHQVWSEAMIVSPVVRGLFGLEPDRGGKTLRFAPQLPADWDRAEVRRFAAADGLYDFALSRGDGRLRIKITRRAAPKDKAPAKDKQAAPPLSSTSTSSSPPPRLVVAPAFPLDARVRSASVNNRAVKFTLTRTGDVQRAEASLDVAEEAHVVFNYDEGTDVYTRVEAPAPGARSRGLRVLRSRADAKTLRLLLEGLGGHTYDLWIRTRKEVEEVEGVVFDEEHTGEDLLLKVTFDGPPEQYVRREITLPLRP